MEKSTENLMETPPPDMPLRAFVALRLWRWLLLSFVRPVCRLCLVGDIRGAGAVWAQERNSERGAGWACSGVSFSCKGACAKEKPRGLTVLHL